MDTQIQDSVYVIFSEDFKMTLIKMFMYRKIWF